MRMRVLFLIFLLCFGFLSPCTFAYSNTQTDASADNETDAEAADEPLEDLLDYDSLVKEIICNRQFNGNILISQNETILFENSYGFSDFRKRIPLTRDSVFQLASVSKQFTSMAIMMLYDEKKLEFDDPVEKYVRGFPYRNVTIRHLLTHRSGLPSYFNFARKYRTGKNPYLTNDDLMKMIIVKRPALRFFPGKKFEYNNTGYAVLASVIENVSGQSYRSYVQEKIFAPLGMKNSYLIDPYAKNSGFTKGYSARKCRPVGIGYLDGVLGDKGIYSTVEDLFLWDKALYTESLVQKRTLEKAFESYGVDRRNNTEYGFGWRIKNLDDGTKIVFHAGLWGGYKTLFVRNLEDHTSVIILSNRPNWHYADVETIMGKVPSSDIAADTPAGGAEQPSSPQ